MYTKCINIRECAWHGHRAHIHDTTRTGRAPSCCCNHWPAQAAPTVSYHTIHCISCLRHLAQMVGTRNWNSVLASCCCVGTSRLHCAHANLTLVDVCVSERIEFNEHSLETSALVACNAKRSSSSERTYKRPRVRTHVPTYALNQRSCVVSSM